MKKTIFTTILLALTIIGLFGSVETIADTPNNKIVYFYDELCEGCRELKDLMDGEYNEDEDYIKMIEDSGIEILYFMISQDLDTSIIPDSVIYNEDETYTVGDLRNAFSDFYEVPENEIITPLMFVGETYYSGEDAIKEAFNSGELQLNAQDDFLEVNVIAGQNYRDIQGFLGFLGVLGAGLLDGFNPCAIALLLMFISLVGFTENKRVLIAVSITYILTMFLSYFLIGLGIMTALETFAASSGLATIVSWIIFILVLIFFVFNFYDFIVSKNEDYGKIKNQLPKWIQKMNKRIMKTFTNSMNDEGGKGNLFGVIALTFLLGVTLSFTEFLCTGQIYLGILDGVRYFHEFYAYFALFAYNVMFVSPMIVIAVIAIKSESIMGVSNWIREHLHIIKLLNSLLFLGIAIYYGFRLFG